MIFINYRRADAAIAAALIEAKLVSLFGRAGVFLDHRSLTGSQDWPEDIQNALHRSSHVVVVIGPDWECQTRPGENGPPDINRLHDPDDWVRRELETALTLKKRIVRVLYDRPTDVSTDFLRTIGDGTLEGLSDVQALKLSAESLESDVNSIVAQLPAPPEATATLSDTPVEQGSDGPQARYVEAIGALLSSGRATRTELQQLRKAVEGLKAVNSPLAPTGQIALDALGGDGTRPEMKPSFRGWLRQHSRLVLCLGAALMLGLASGVWIALEAERELLSADAVNAAAIFGHLGLVAACCLIVARARCWRCFTGKTSKGRERLLERWTRRGGAAVDLKRAMQARDQFRIGWAGLWIAWTALYVGYASQFAIEHFVPTAEQNPFFNRVVLESLLSLCNNGATGGLFLGFWVLSHITTSKYQGTESREKSDDWEALRRALTATMWKLIGSTLAVVAFLFVMQFGLSWWVFPDEGETLKVMIYPNVGFSMLSGVIAGAVHAGFIGRLDSKFIGVGKWTLALLYIYAAIQALFPLITHPVDQTNSLIVAGRGVVFALALGLKLLLFLAVSWIAKTGRLDFYFLRVRALYDTVNQNWHGLTASGDDTD